MVPAQMAQCNQVDTLQFVGSLFLTGAALPFLNQEFWIAAAEQAICLSTKGLGPQVRLALRDPYVCIQLQAPSCRQQCFRAAASRPWQELLGSRTFGNEIVRPHFPAFWSAAELGLTASRFNGTRPCRIRSYLSPAPQWVEPPAVELGLRAGRQETGVLGVYHDTGLDFGGAVLYRGANTWPPLFLRHYQGEWCVELGWCYVNGCFGAAGPVGPCHSPWFGCRQGIEVWAGNGGCGQCEYSRPLGLVIWFPAQGTRQTLCRR